MLQSPIHLNLRKAILPLYLQTCCRAVGHRRINNKRPALVQVSQTGNFPGRLSERRPREEARHGRRCNSEHKSSTYLGTLLQAQANRTTGLAGISTERLTQGWDARTQDSPTGCGISSGLQARFCPRDAAFLADQL